MDKKFGLSLIVIALTIGLGAMIAFTGSPDAIEKVKGTDDLLRGGAYFKGTEGSKVEIVEFSDLQCPACKSASKEIREAMDIYGDKVVFYYRHFPLSQHKFAKDAAYAAEAAGLQDKFWEMHDAIFANQSDLSLDLFPKLAGDLGLDVAKFNEDRKSADIKKIVEKDKADGGVLKVKSTPTFFVNGEKLEGGLKLDDWKKLIDGELNKDGE